MYKKKKIRVPVFDAETDEWIGVFRIARTKNNKDFLDDCCYWEGELDGEGREDVSDSIGYPVLSGWFSDLGGNRIYVVIG